MVVVQAKKSTARRAKTPLRSNTPTSAKSPPKSTGSASQPAPASFASTDVLVQNKEKLSVIKSALDETVSREQDEVRASTHSSTPTPASRCSQPLWDDVNPYDT